jgi:outer membrane protein assembly factor BamA
MASGDLSQEGLETTTELEDQKFVAPFLAYVHDTTLYTAIGPLDGKRSRMGLHPAFGEMTYLTLLADYRWYWHLTKRSTLASRVMTIGSFGENARIFNIGGPGTFRGRESDADDSLQGTRVVLGNVAYRFPLLPQINILRGAIFLDTALVWTNKVQPFTTAKTDWVRLQDLHAAYGVGFRIPIQGPFGLLNVRLDIAQETDFSKNLGKRKILFSIGNDF